MSSKLIYSVVELSTERMAYVICMLLAYTIMV